VYEYGHVYVDVDDNENEYEESEERKIDFRLWTLDFGLTDLHPWPA
jgi:hypothetical protein